MEDEKPRCDKCKTQEDVGFCQECKHHLCDSCAWESGSVHAKCKGAKS